jgi:hypothetical protein
MFASNQMPSKTEQIVNSSMHTQEFLGPLSCIRPAIYGLI